MQERLADSPPRQPRGRPPSHSAMPWKQNRKHNIRRANSEHAGGAVQSGEDANAKDTSAAYESWIRLHIFPKWGRAPITDLQARPVELWLESLPLAPKSKVHIRGILSSLWNFAMWKQAIPMQVNPISLVTVKGASKRIRQPRSLTVEQFRLLVSHLREPFNTLALMCVCFGLRISEALALNGLTWIG